MIPSIVIFILFIDQLSKFIVSNTLLLNQPNPVIKSVFAITLVHNRGAAFGMMKGQTILFIATSICAIILIYRSLKINKHGATSLNSVALALILAGALGNLIDRLFFGYVIDFFDFHIWPVFNIADSSITIGAVLFGWHILSSERPKN